MAIYFFGCCRHPNVTWHEIWKEAHFPVEALLLDNHQERPAYIKGRREKDFFFSGRRRTQLRVLLASLQLYNTHKCWCYLSSSSSCSIHPRVFLPLPTSPSILPLFYAQPRTQGHFFFYQIFCLLFGCLISFIYPLRPGLIAARWWNVRFPKKKKESTRLHHTLLYLFFCFLRAW